MSRRHRIALGTGTIVFMGVLLVIYAILHSPFRQPIYEALFGRCDFFCRTTRIAGPVPSAISSVWFIGAVLIGAIPLALRAVPSTLERVVAWGLIAYALLVIPSALIAFVGDRIGLKLLHPPLGPMLASIPAVVAIGWGWRAGWRPSLPRIQMLVEPTPLLLFLGALAIASVLIQTGFAVQYPPSGFDDLGYHAPLAVLFWHDGSLETFMSRFAGTPVLSHPGGAELWQGLLLMIGGEPLALVSQVPFALLGAAGVALFGRRLGLRQGAALMAALLYLLAPMLTEQVGHIRDDVVGASMVVVTGAFLAGARDERLPARLTLAGLGIGMMAVTKLALLPAIGAMTLLFAWVVWREMRSGRDMRPIWRATAFGLGLAALAVAPWWIRNLMLHGNPLFPLNLPIIGRGMKGGSPPDSRYVPDKLLWPVYPLLEPYSVANGFGGAFAVGIIPGLVGAAMIARRRPVLILAVLALVSLPLWFFLDKREPRFLLGMVAIAFAFIPFGLVVLTDRWRKVGMVILAIAALVTVAAQWATMLPNQTVERVAFYDEAWGVLPATGALPESEGLILDDRCNEAGANRLYPYFGAGRKRELARIECDGMTTDRILKVLKKNDLSYVYVVVPHAQLAGRQALYPADTFTLVSQGTWDLPTGVLLDRVLYHWNDAPPPKVKGGDAGTDTPGSETDPGADSTGG